MQVKNEPLLPSHIQNDKSLVLKEGDTFQAVVKEKLPNNEAVLRIKGQDVRVKYEGDLPSTGKVAITVNGFDNGTPIVRKSPTTNSQTPQGKEGVPPSTNGINVSSSIKADLAKAIETLKNNGIPITKNTFNNIASFMEKEFGSPEQKLETIKKMAQKGLEFTPVQLKSVHEALHGARFSETFRELAKDIPTNQNFQINKNTKVFSNIQPASLQEKINHIRQALQQSNVTEALAIAKTIESYLPENIQKIVSQAKQLHEAAGRNILDALQNGPKDQELFSIIKEQIQKGTNIQDIINLIKSSLSKEAIESNHLLKAMDSALKLEQQATATLINRFPAFDIENETNESPTLQLAIKAVRKEPNIQTVLAVIKEQLLDSKGLSQVQEEKLQAALSKAQQLVESGRELASRQELMTVLDQIQKESGATDRNVAVQTETYQLNDEFIGTLPIQSRDFIVSRITKKLSQLAIDFKDVKRDITRNLQSIEILLDKHKNLAAPQVKPLLEATIKQLDQVLLKSDFMLYTDMATEKKILKASSQLAEARKLLEKGDYVQASRITQEVKNMFEKLMFKPSDTRMQHFVSKELFELEQASLPKQLVHNLESSMQSMKDAPTGRQVFEHLRSLGLTYEAEQARSLISKGQEQQGAQDSLKSVLLKLSQSEAEQAFSQKADQLLTQLTGQQLLSKTDTSSLQSMMFTLPFLLKDQTEQVKVFVNSKNSQEKVDWENCSLYFLLETKKLGEVGILLSAVDRTLSVTIKNDKPDFKDKVEPLALKAKERLKEIGYNIGSVQFTKLSNEPEKEELNQQAPKRSVPHFTGRGYDFTI